MRPTLDSWGLQLAMLTSRRGTCLRRQVGCVLVNARGHVLATGYNGVASGLPHCNDEAVATKVEYSEWYGVKMPVTSNHVVHPHACPGAKAPSGTNLDGCQAIHAEQNALLQCRDVYEIHTLYSTTSPCMTCVKLLLNTGCQRIVFLDEYPHPEASALWMGAGRDWEQMKIV